MANFYGEDIEDSVFGGGPDLYGGNGNDILYGGAATNELYGGQGNDIMGGGPGIATAGSGTVADPFFYTFGPSGDDILDGGNGDDGVEGGDGNDIVYGGSGNDAGVMGGWGGLLFRAGLYGGDGNDSVYGGEGSDLVNGGLGTDKLWGGSGLDIFEYNSVLESVPGPARDIIYDFSRFDHDRIDLSAIDARDIASRPGDQQFRFIGKDAFSDRAGELRFFKKKVSGDTDGDGTADFQIKVIGVDRMVRGDFDL